MVSSPVAECVDSSEGPLPEVFKLEIPEAVRGMKELKKELFSSKVTIPVLKVDATKVSVIQRKVRLERFLFKNLDE